MAPTTRKAILLRKATGVDSAVCIAIAGAAFLQASAICKPTQRSTSKRRRRVLFADIAQYLSEQEFCRTFRMPRNASN
jgi:hypothetical protein